MSEREQEFLKELKKTFFNWMIVSVGGVLLTAAISLIPFYFNTTNKVNNNSKELDKKADKTVIEYRLNTIDGNISEIKQDIKDLKK